MINEKELQACIQSLKGEGPAEVKMGTADMLKYLEALLLFVQFWKDVFGEGGKYYKPKWIQFSKIWGIVTSLFGIGKKLKII